jgi:hypothetical protein
MPKKKNFLGGMQNYDPKTGEYESRLTKANGEPATKENMPGGEEGGKSFKSFKKTEKPKKTQMTYDELGDYLDETQSETVETIDIESKKKGDEGYNQWSKLDKEERPYLSDYLYNDVFNGDREKTHDYLVSISKNPNRKDEYGNLLASDRAFKAGQRGARAYLENMLKYYDMDSLRGSNVFLGYMQTAVNDAIAEEGFNEEFDMTYQDINEILGSILGEEIDMESYGHDATKGWTRKPYKGYQPEETETSPEVKKK